MLDIVNSTLPTELIQVCNNQLAMPEVIFIWAMTLFLFVAVGMLSIEGKESKKKFFKIWLIVFFLTGISVLAIVKMPNSVLTFKDWILGTFS